MERIGSQVRLPLGTAIGISLQGIRIRLGRALVTLSGVVLGIAFLMNVLTGELVKNAVSREQGIRQTVTLMSSLVKSEIGSARGKRIAVAVVGGTSVAERELVREIKRARPAEMRVRDTSLSGIGKDVALLLLLGDGKTCPTSMAELTNGMTQAVMLDSLSSRTFAGSRVSSVRREFFFGKDAQAAEKVDKARAAQDRVRTIWIVTVSLLVTVIGISNALLMSVTERFKEIGTMKCLGALSGFIRQLFLVESAIIGISGSIAGVVIGALFPIAAYGLMYGFPVVLGSMNYGQLALYSVICLSAGTLLSMLAAIYPATVAARMVPAMALRSNV